MQLGVITSHRRYVVRAQLLGYRSHQPQRARWPCASLPGIHLILHVGGRESADRREVRRNACAARSMALGAGGVGYYPESDFLHIDTGAVRSWGSKSA